MEEQKNQQEQEVQQQEVTTEQELVEPVEEQTAEVEEKVVEKDEQEQVGEAGEADAKTEETSETSEEVQEEVPTEEDTKQEDISESDKAEEEPEKEPSEVSETVEESPAEVDEAPAEQPEEQVEEQSDELTKVRVELEDAKAEIEERDAIEKFNKDTAIANAQYSDFLTKLGDAMNAEFAKYGIDANKTLEELEKEDAAKANVARGIISQAQRLKEEAGRNMANNLNAEFNNVVFTKASRLFEKFNLTQEQAEVAAETFIGILGQAGLKDFAQDLASKVELSVARARMIAPKVFEAVKEVKEAAEKIEQVVETVSEQKVEDEKPETDTVEDAAPTEEKQEVVEQAPDINEFMESAVNTPSSPSDSVTVDNALSKLNAIKNDKERVAFYKAHFNVIEEACRRRVDRKMK